MAAGDPLIEATLLRDVHRAAMEDHIAYLARLNAAIARVSDHAVAGADAHERADSDAARRYARLGRS